MKIEKKRTRKNVHSYEIEGVSPVIINALRRMIISSVPTMAIDEVEIRKNSSAMYDEMLAHRLGLLVLKTDLNSYNLPEECSCGGVGCAKCTVVMTLSAKGPGYVYASQLKSKDPKIKPVYENTPITYLEEGQEIELEAYARLGRGSQHAKWSPAHVWYVTEDEKKGKYTLYIEPWGQLSVKEILRNAIDEILKGIKSIQSYF